MSRKKFVPDVGRPYCRGCAEPGWQGLVLEVPRSAMVKEQK